MRPTLLLLGLVAALSTACAGVSDSEDAQASADELSSLRGLAVTGGAVEVGGSVTVKYEPSAYDGNARLPFLAIEIVPQGGAAKGLRPANRELGGATNIAVSGEFPGSPRVLVVDDQFRVLGGTDGISDPAGGQRADLAVEGGTPRFVLVRDLRWIRPMSFTVDVGR